MTRFFICFGATVWLSATAAVALEPNGQRGCRDGKLFVGFTLSDLGISELPVGAVVSVQGSSGGITRWRFGGELKESVPRNHVYWGWWLTHLQKKFGNLNNKYVVKWPDGAVKKFTSRPKGRAANLANRERFKTIARTCPQSEFNAAGDVPLKVLPD